MTIYHPASRLREGRGSLVNPTREDPMPTLFTGPNANEHTQEALDLHVRARDALTAIVEDAVAEGHDLRHVAAILHSAVCDAVTHAAMEVRFAQPATPLLRARDGVDAGHYIATAPDGD